MWKIINKSITSLGKNSVIYGFGTVITRFINVLLLPFFTSYLSPHDYGVLALLAFLGQVLQPIFSLGLGSGMGPCYFEGNDEDTKASAVWGAFVLLLLSNGILLTIGLFLSKQFSTLLFSSADYAEFTTLSIGSVVLGNLNIPLTHRLQFEEKPKPFVLISILISLSTILLNVVLVIFIGLGVKGMLIGQITGAALGFALFLLYVTRWTRFSICLSMVRNLLRLSLPLVPSSAFVFILMNGNKYLLQWLSTLDALGVYSVGTSFGAFMNIFTGAFQTAWYPYFMSFIDKPFDAKPRFRRVFNYYVIFFGSLTLLFFIFARSVTITMTQPPFHDAFRIVGFSALSYFFIGLYSILLPPLYYKKKVKEQSIIQGIACIPYIIMGILLIQLLGAFGAAIGLSIGFFFMLLITWLWVKKKYNDLHISYGFKQNVSYAIYFSVIIAIFTINRNFNIIIELAIAITALVSLVLFLIKSLNSEQKKEIEQIYKRIIVAFNEKMKLYRAH